METKNTPTPWKRQARNGPKRWRIVDANGSQVAYVNYCNADADYVAELIPRACNSHEQLVEALKRFISYGDVFLYRQADGNPYEQAKAALIAAGAV